MNQSKLREDAMNMVKGMNLVDIKLYPDDDGEVSTVLLKYMDPRYGKGRGLEKEDLSAEGREPLVKAAAPAICGGIYRGQTFYGGDANA